MAVPLHSGEHASCRIDGSVFRVDPAALQIGGRGGRRPNGLGVFFELSHSNPEMT